MSGKSGKDAEDSWSLNYAGRSEKDLERLDRPSRQRVLGALGKLAADPHAGQLRRLKTRPESRLRVGELRVLLELHPASRAITVKRVLPRGRAYDR
jgi:mRNA interferase RelE/StbE